MGMSVVIDKTLRDRLQRTQVDLSFILMQLAPDEERDECTETFLELMNKMTRRPKVAEESLS